jgi:hypothetical protein
MGRAAALGAVAIWVVCAGLYQTLPAAAQQAGAGPQAQGRGGRGGGPPAPPPDDNAGFESIFDGKTLHNWDGDPMFWRVENGAIVGESTAEKPVKVNTFVVWRGGTTKDFELRLEYRINSTNSGVQFRSAMMPERGRWAMKGYQADIDAENRYTGQIYEEQGRGFLAMRGLFTRIGEGGKPKMLGSLGESDALKAFIRNNDWNQLHLAARGNVIVQTLNGHVTSALIDDDPKGRAMDGLLGMQIHVGPPMKVEFRNILFKKR